MRIGLCLFHKDENSYLKEWLAHHRKLGVTHFYIYDNGSDRMPSNEADVTVIDWSSDQTIGKQMRAYYDCFKRVKAKVDWLGFIDTDEFILGDLQGLLASAGRAAQVSISTRLYGSNGLESKAKKQVGAYGKAWMANNHVKSFVNTAFHMKNVPYDPHFMPMTGRSVDVVGQVCSGPIHPHNDAPVVIDHYYTRSREEWAEKCDRGRGDGAGSRTMEEFEQFNKQVDENAKN
jgi:hypothetical protein